MTGIAPVFQIIRLIEQDAAFVRFCSGAQNHMVFAILFPDLGVADMAAAEIGIVRIGEEDFLFTHGMAVLRGYVDDIGASAGGGVVVVPVLQHITGVKNFQGVAADNGAAGIGAVLIRRHIRADNHAGVSPVYQIGTFKMAPAAVTAAFGIEGGVLEVNMVFVIKIRKTVRVVHPALRGLQMQFLTIGIGVHKYRPFCLFQ